MPAEEEKGRWLQVKLKDNAFDCGFVWRGKERIGRKCENPTFSMPPRDRGFNSIEVFLG